MPPGFDRFENFCHDELTAKHCYFRCSRPPDVDGIKIFDKDDQATKHFLNQARTSRRPARAWFFEIVFVRTSVCVCVYVFVCVCPPLRLLITSGVM